MISIRAFLAVRLTQLSLDSLLYVWPSDLISLVHVLLLLKGIIKQLAYMFNKTGCCVECKHQVCGSKVKDTLGSDLRISSAGNKGLFKQLGVYVHHDEMLSLLQDQVLCSKVKVSLKWPISDQTMSGLYLQLALKVFAVIGF